MFIEFKNVTFKYPDSEEYVLHNLSFSIEKGNMLTILGHNGSGKSTIAKLIMGLLQPNEGSIYIDGVELTEKTVDSSNIITSVSIASAPAIATRCFWPPDKFSGFSSR